VWAWERWPAMFRGPGAAFPLTLTTVKDTYKILTCKERLHLKTFFQLSQLGTDRRFVDLRVEVDW